MQTILFIDWENFKRKLQAVFDQEKQERPEWPIYDFEGLFQQVLQGIKIDQITFYAAQLSIHQSTPDKSKELVDQQRLLKTSLEKRGFAFVYGGRVRGNLVWNHKNRSTPTFREKGVDVKIAVDLMRLACDGKLKTAILASSDSDLQPAVREIVSRKVECIYLGFEKEPNKGLMYTTSRTILIRNSEVIKFLPQRLV